MQKPGKPDSLPALLVKTMPMVLGTSTFSVPFIPRSLPDLAPELHFPNLSFADGVPVEEFIFTFHIPLQYQLQISFGLPNLVSSGPDTASIFSSGCLSLLILYICFCFLWAQSVGSPMCCNWPQLAACCACWFFLHVGKVCFCALRREFRRMTGCHELLCSFPGHSAYHSLSKPQLCCCESRVFSLLLSFLSLLKILCYHFTITSSKAAVGCHMHERFFLIHEYQVLCNPSHRSLFSASTKNCSQCMWEIPWIFHTLLCCPSSRCCMI